jgi:hypothetical protein
VTLRRMQRRLIARCLVILFVRIQLVGNRKLFARPSRRPVRLIAGRAAFALLCRSWLRFVWLLLRWILALLLANTVFFSHLSLQLMCVACHAKCKDGAARSENCRGAGRTYPIYTSGTRSSSAGQASAWLSLGACQSLRGDNHPPEPLLVRSAARSA